MGACISRPAAASRRSGEAGGGDKSGEENVHSGSAANGATPSGPTHHQHQQRRFDHVMAAVAASLATASDRFASSVASETPSYLLRHIQRGGLLHHASSVQRTNDVPLRSDSHDASNSNHNASAAGSVASSYGQFVSLVATRTGPRSAGGGADSLMAMVQSRPSDINSSTLEAMEEVVPDFVPLYLRGLSSTCPDSCDDMLLSAQSHHAALPVDAASLCGEADAAAATPTAAAVAHSRCSSNESSSSPSVDTNLSSGGAFHIKAHKAPKVPITASWEDGPLSDHVQSDGY